MKMKLVKETPTEPDQWRNRLPCGTIFRYLHSDIPYIKTDYGHTCLADGLHWREMPDAKVIVLEATLTYKDKT